MPLHPQAPRLDAATAVRYELAHNAILAAIEKVCMHVLTDTQIIAGLN
jgi:hypothetical protein